MAGVTGGAAAQLPVQVPAQVIGLRVIREANDGKRDRASYTDAAAALEAVRAFLAIPGTYQVTIFVME